MPTPDWTQKNKDRFMGRQLGPLIAKMKNGRFKVYWSWDTAVGMGLGPNLKFSMVRGQPVNGWATIHEAKMFECSLSAIPDYEVGNGYGIPNRQFAFCTRCGESYGAINVYDHKCRVNHPIKNFPVNREDVEIGIGHPPDLTPLTGPPVVFVRMKLSLPAGLLTVVRDDKLQQVSVALTDEEVAALRAQLIELEMRRLENERLKSKPD